MTLPLEHVRVLDLTRALAGPYCAMMLGDMGADVIKIEQPGVGDNARAWGPPFQNGESSYFLSINRNKRSVALDLRDQRAQEALRRLVAESDVLLENFVPGTMERYGFSYEACRAIKPDLIYCSISGFGQLGPDRERAAYDQILQGMGGLMSITGEVGGAPQRVGIAIADIVAGMFAAFGVVTALHHRQRTGQGQMIDTSLLDGQLALLTYQAGRFFATGEAPGSSGAFHPTIVPYGMYAASDGYFNVAVGTDDLWRRFCQALEQDTLASDERLATNQGRLQHRAVVDGVLMPFFAQLPVAEIEAKLNAVGVPCGAVLNIEQVFNHPQVAALGSVRPLEHPTAGPISVVAPPYRFSETPADIRLPPPTLGQHTGAVLADLGFSQQEIDDMRAANVIG